MNLYTQIVITAKAAIQLLSSIVEAPVLCPTWAGVTTKCAGLLSIQPIGRVQYADCQFGLVLVNQDADLNLRC